jgi:hypothetical protein
MLSKGGTMTTRQVLNRSLRAALTLSLIACGQGPSGSALGVSCHANTDCASGMCVDTNASSSYCTVTCTADANCATTNPNYDLFCDTSAGHCARQCLQGQTQGSGASLALCMAGSFVACSTMDPASACTACTCAPFGGGTCVMGMGCVHPQADGSACTTDAMCSSGACYRDTHVCGAPRATGMPCVVDAECASQNCSTDGITSTPGHCNQGLGTQCSQTAGGFVTPTCNYCVVVAGAGGTCLRDHCSTPSAGCPVFANHEFRCAAGGSDGYEHCFEWCPSDIHTCFYNTLSCYQANDYCR